MATFKFCIHRTDNGDEKAVLLGDLDDVLAIAIETHFADASLARRLRDPGGVARDALDAALASLDDLARDRTLRL